VYIFTKKYTGNTQLYNTHMSYSVYIVYLKRELKMFSASPAESEISFGPAPPPPAPATANKVTTTTGAKGRREPAQHGVLSN
jgi:hypothetical protein